MSGVFVVSLDFELHWGVRDMHSVASYQANLLGARRAIPRILNSFAEHDIHATWAAVGFLFARDRDELIGLLPTERPYYDLRSLDPYPDLEACSKVGRDENDDPFHYGASLIKRIAATPHQEVGSHTFSHYYCGEAGQDSRTFRADLTAAVRAAAIHKLRLRSIVFPRNQANQSYLATCREAGLVAYRGNPEKKLYRDGDRPELWRRALRLIDAYLALSGDTSYSFASIPNRTSAGIMYNVAASRFLRPWSPRTVRLEPLRIRRIERGLEEAAKRNRVYHLWWHPHNFGVYTDANLDVLRRILERFTKLRRIYGMESLNMAELAARMAGPGGRGHGG